MDAFAVELNAILVEVYHNITRLEEQDLQKSSNVPLSINEIHLIECVGKGGPEGRTISDLAADLAISRPSATVAVKKAERKGYVEKIRSGEDGRVVRVHLTSDGRRMDAFHRCYHKDMVQTLSADFSEEEKSCLMKAFHKLNLFFRRNAGEIRDR